MSTNHLHLVGSQAHARRGSHHARLDLLDGGGIGNHAITSALTSSMRQGHGHHGDMSQVHDAQSQQKDKRQDQCKFHQVLPPLVTGRSSRQKSLMKGLSRREKRLDGHAILCYP